MEATLTITMSLPQRELNPNGRYHWATKAKAVKLYRNEAKICTKMALTDQYKGQAGKVIHEAMPFRACRAKCTFFFPDRRVRDNDNLLASMKSAFDGVVDAGLLADDDQITHLPSEKWEQGGEQHDPRVEIHLELE